MLTTYLLEKLRFSTLYLRWPLGNAQLHKAVKNKIGLPQKRSPGAPPSQLLSEEVTHGEGCSSYLLYPMPLCQWQVWYWAQRSCSWHSRPFNMMLHLSPCLLDRYCPWAMCGFSSHHHLHIQFPCSPLSSRTKSISSISFPWCLWQFSSAAFLRGWSSLFPAGNHLINCLGCSPYPNTSVCCSQQNLKSTIYGLVGR